MNYISRSALILALIVITSACSRQAGIQLISDLPHEGGVSEKELFSDEEASENLKSNPRPKSGIVGAYAHHSSSSLSDQSNQAYHYGYGQLDSLLAYADYARWRDPSIVSVLRVLYGPNARVRASGVLTGKDTWDMGFTSSNKISILRVFQGSGSIAGDSINLGSDEKSVSIKWTTDDQQRSGVILAIHGSQSDYGCVDSGFSNDSEWYNRSSNPWSSGYNGYFNGSYYYFPPDPCSYSRSNMSLDVGGTVVVDPNACSTEGFCTLMAISPSPISGQLSRYLNSQSGYFPLFRQDYHNTDLLTVRFVNFNGLNWY